MFRIVGKSKINPTLVPKHSNLEITQVKRRKEERNEATFLGLHLFLAGRYRSQQSGHKNPLFPARNLPVTHAVTAVGFWAVTM